MINCDQQLSGKQFYFFKEIACLNVVSFKVSIKFGLVIQGLFRDSSLNDLQLCRH